MKRFLKFTSKKHHEFLLYALFGVGTVAADLGLYALTVDTWGIRMANVAGWFGAVLFAFFTNKYWVFRRRSGGLRSLILEFLEFAAARFMSLLVQVFGTDALVRHGLSRSVLGVKGGLAKGLITIVVIAINYVFSKFLIFRPRGIRS